MSDPHLLAAIASGSTEAPEDAEEVVQDVFAQVWRDAKKYEQGRATVAGWLVMLTRTRAIDKLRARKARPDLDQANDPVPILQASLSKSLTPEALALSSADAARVGAALEALPDEQRKFIDLAYFEGLSQSEIAEHTGTPLGTVKTRMRTALHTMRAALSS